MKVKEIVNYLFYYQELFKKGIVFDFVCSAPWHFNKPDIVPRVPLGSESGIYIYTRPNEGNWEVNIEDNNSDIWYIGKSAGDIGGRVWAHMGLMYEPETKKICNPIFKYNDWSEDNSVDPKIRDSISNGNLVVYTIKISPKEFNPEVVEKYLLSCYYKAKGCLPPLNKGI